MGRRMVETKSGATAKCDECGGAGLLPGLEKQKPSDDAMEAIYGWCEFQKGVLPVSGGMFDQSSAFVRALRFLGSVDGYYQRVEFEKHKKQAEAASAKARSAGRKR